MRFFGYKAKDILRPSEIPFLSPDRRPNTEIPDEHPPEALGARVFVGKKPA